MQGELLILKIVRLSAHNLNKIDVKIRLRWIQSKTYKIEVKEICTFTMEFLENDLKSLSSIQARTEEVFGTDSHIDVPK